jgi:hypothetical protein
MPSSFVLIFCVFFAFFFARSVLLLTPLCAGTDAGVKVHICHSSRPEILAQLCLDGSTEVGTLSV